MQAAVLSALLLGAAACHTSSPTESDGAVNGTPDAPPSGAVGLSVAWSTSPQTIPGTIMGDITVTGMLFRLMDLRVIGDAGPGDPRTTMDNFELTWADGMPPPPNVVFADAPSGLYSKVSLIADGELIDYSYEIDGTVKLQGVTQPFKIHDRSPIAVELDTNTTLDPGKSATVGIEIHLDDAISSIDFTMLDTENGVLDLDTLDDQMSSFRTKMIAGFVEHGSGDN